MVDCSWKLSATESLNLEGARVIRLPNNDVPGDGLGITTLGVEGTIQ